jgi:hypothetical protein
LALVSRAPLRLAGPLDLVAHLLAFGYALVLLRYTYRLALHSFQVQERSWAAVPFPIYPFKILLFLGALAFTVVIAWEVVMVLTHRRASLAARDI